MKKIFSFEREAYENQSNITYLDERQRVLGHDFVVVYEKLFFFLAIASDLKLISFKQHANISRILDEIGKQATGWRKSTAKK